MVVKGKTLTLKERWQKLKDELKGMTPKQKLEHLWEYYKWVLGVALIVVFMVGMLVSMAVTRNTEVLMSGVLINVDVDLEGYAYLKNGYFEKCGGVKYQHAVEVSYRQYEDGNLTLDPAKSFDSYQSVLAMMAASSLDYMIMDELALETFVTPEFSLDLRQFLTEEELEAYKDDLIWVINENTGETLPLALNISDLEFTRNCVPISAAEVPIYIAITCPDERIDETRDFWDYLLAYEATEQTP